MIKTYSIDNNLACHAFYKAMSCLELRVFVQAPKVVWLYCRLGGAKREGGVCTTLEQTEQLRYKNKVNHKKETSFPVMYFARYAGNNKEQGGNN